MKDNDNLKKIYKNLENKKDHHKMTILYSFMGVSMFLVIFLWSFQLKNRFAPETSEVAITESDKSAEKSKGEKPINLIFKNVGKLSSDFRNSVFGINQTASVVNIETKSVNKFKFTQTENPESQNEVQKKDLETINILPKE